MQSWLGSFVWPLVDGYLLVALGAVALLPSSQSDDSKQVPRYATTKNLESVDRSLRLKLTTLRCCLRFSRTPKELVPCLQSAGLTLLTSGVLTSAESCSSDIIGRVYVCLRCARCTVLVGMLEAVSFS